MATQNDPYSPEFINSFAGSGFTFDQFEQLVAKSALLGNLITVLKNTSGGKITLSGKDPSGHDLPVSSGTGTIGKVIYIDPMWAKDFGPQNALDWLADALAHELGHALLDNGESDHSNDKNPEDAILTGEKAEGAALASEYIVAKQLRASGDKTFQNGKLLIEFSDRTGNKIASALGTLSTLSGGNAQDFSQLNGTAFLAASSVAGALYSSNAPSTDKLETYKTSWVAAWLFGTGISQELGKARVDQDRITGDLLQGNFTESGTAATGWSFLGKDLALKVGPNGEDLSKTAETLSFSATESPDGNIVVGTQTFSAGASATLIGGQDGEDIFYGQQGTDTYEIGVFGGVQRIVCNASGAGSIIAGIASPQPFKLDPDLLQVVSPNHWKDGELDLVFTPGDQLGTVLPPNVLSGIDAGKRPAFSPDVGVLTIANFNGLTTLQLIGFNLTQALSSTGFLGIDLRPTASINFGGIGNTSQITQTFVGGGSEAYTLSVDAPYSADQIFTVTVSAAALPDFQVRVGDSIEDVGANGTFNITLAANQTNVSFSLIDESSQNASSDVLVAGPITLAASLHDGADPDGPPMETNSLTFDYDPAPSDNTQAPNPASDIEGQFDSVTGITTYNGDGGDDFITGTGDHNLINADNSGNDSITGGTGTNTIIGSPGEDVITLNGAHDDVILGSGFNTLYGGTGEETITSNSGDAFVYANGGTDLILLGNGNNHIFAGSATNLADAIANAGSGSPTGNQGDLIAVRDGDNTIVGGDGNDLIEAGAGHDVIVMGPGDDTFVGGEELTSAAADWSTTIIPPSGQSNFSLQVDGADISIEGYTNPYAQPYNGRSESGTGLPAGPANDTIFGGDGDSYYTLGNGDNYLSTGDGNDTVFGGMGNVTIIAGDGDDTIRGSGGTTYIEGGAGHDTITGGDGDNTIIGGSGDSTIISWSSPNGDQDFPGDTLDHNYVFGGSGNDIIYGSDGNDTLVAGSGNTAIYGGEGNEFIEGGSGSDFLQSAGNSTIIAGSGRDSLLANGADTSTSYLYGGDASDALQGGSGTNYIYAGDGGTGDSATSAFASLSDSSAVTTIFGGAGVDFLQGGAGATVIYGGDGGVAGASTSILGLSGDMTVFGGSGLEAIQGGSGNNLIYAGDGGTDDAPLTLLGGTGVSTLYGGVGSDILQDEESGRDLIVAGGGESTVFGTGVDTLVAGTGDDIMEIDGGSVTVQINGPTGSDDIINNGGITNLAFGSGISPDDLTGSLGIGPGGEGFLNISGDGITLAVENALTGGLGSVDFADSGSISDADLIKSLVGTDLVALQGANQFILNVEDSESIRAGANSDTVASWGADDSVLAGGHSNGDVIYSAGADADITSITGRDTITAAGGGAIVEGGEAGDQVILSGANSVFTGATGEDTVTASGANETLIGGSGNSTFVVNNTSTVVDVSAGTAVDSVIASVSYTAPTNVDVLTLTGSANIAATGNSGNDTLTAGAGADTLLAGIGLATLIGGTGNTTFVVNNSGDVVLDTSTTTNNQIQASVSFSLPTNVNVLSLTGTANLVGTANSGNDTLISNSGIDTLYGGSGTDTFVINNAADVIVPGTGPVNVIVESSGSYTLGSTALTLLLTGTANLIGTADGGNDTLISNSGVDTLYGGSGNDTFVVNNSGDVVIDTSTASSNTAVSSVSYSLPTNVNTLTLVGSAAVVGTGNAGPDVIMANSGNSTLVAGTGVATLIGGSGNDTFVVDSTADVVQDTFTTTSNTIQSSVSYSLAPNTNTLVLTGTANLTGTGNSGTDTLVSNSGIDTLVGGIGNDTFIIHNSGDVIQAVSSSASYTAISSVSYSLPGFINTLVLTGTANLVATSNSGSDSLVGNAGADTLVATTGLDTLVAGSGLATMIGGPGADLFVVNNTGDTVIATGGSHGVDTIQSSVSYTLPSGATILQLTGSANLAGAAISGNNSLVGNTGNDTLYAGSGSDTLVAGSGPTTLVGGSGTDTFVVNSAADVLQSVSGSGSNRVVSSVSFTMPTGISILTLSGYDPLMAVGNSAASTIQGSFGNDTLVAGSGAATLQGGQGADVFVINSSADVVTNPYSGTKGAQDTIESSISYTLPTTVNVLRLTGTANLAALGNDQADSIVGNSGADTLTAGRGNDTLVAGTGPATLIGAGGDDTFVIDSAADVVVDTSSTSQNVLFSTVSYTLPSNVDTLLLSGSASLVATGNSDSDSIRGNAGADTLIAGSGNDTLASGSGLDTFIAGAGNDTFVINNAADVIQNASSGSHNSVLSSSSFSLPSNVNVLTLTGNNAVGTGNAGADTLIAGGQADTLTAGSGLATMIGGSGDTTFVINSASDLVVDSSATANNTIESSVSYSLIANVNTLELTGTGNLTGSANAGNDTLISNSGVDTLTGGAGNDTFVVNNAADVIQDSSATSNNTIRSSVSYSAATNVSTLVLTGTGNLTATANSGNDTLVSNSGIDTLFGGAAADVFVVNNAADLVMDTATGVNNSVVASVSYTLPGNVNAITLVDTTGLVATGNSTANVITASSSGSDTLVAGSGVATLVGGSGNDTFVVDNLADVVQDGSTTAVNTIQSSVSYTAAANVDTLILTGTAALTATANSGNDTLISNSGVDTLIGGSGHDLFVINNSADVIQGATTGDTIESSVAYTLPSGINDLILIGTANISATGNAGSDLLVAGAGADTLIAGSGATTLTGGTGNDTFVINSSSDLVEDSVAGTTNTIVSSVSVNLPDNIDTLILTGTAGLIGQGNTDASNVLTANSGNDLLIGNSYDNTLLGGNGADTLDAGPGTNVINSGNGGTTLKPTLVFGNSSAASFITENTIYGGSGVNVLYGGPGTDVIYAGTGTTSVLAGTGFDTIYGGGGGEVLQDSQSAGFDLLVAGSGAETLFGTSADTMVAGTGNDYLDETNGLNPTFVLNAGFGHDTLSGPNQGSIVFGTGLEPGNTTISAAAGFASPALVFTIGGSSVTVLGGLAPSEINQITYVDTGPQTLKSLMNADGPGSQTVAFGSGNILLSTGNGKTVTGGTGSDFIAAFGDNDSLSAYLDDPVFHIQSQQVYAYGDNNTISGGYGNDTLWTDGNNALFNAFGNDTVYAFGANDTIKSFDYGSDDFGQTDRQEIVISQSSTVVQATSGGIDTVLSSANYTLPDNVAELILTGDSLSGSSNAQGGKLIAQGSDSTLTGGSGQDTLIAEGLADTLVGGSGPDTFLVFNPDDVIQPGSNAASDTVQSSADYTLPTGIGTLIVTGVGVTGTGNSGNDLITSDITGGTDTLVAGSGNDTLQAISSGGYTLIGGSGNDTFIVGAAGVVVLDSYTTTNNVLQSAVSYTLPVNVNTLIMTGSQNVLGIGNSANDFISGNSGDDTLIAGSGNDTLVSGSGVDTLVAGSGNDTLQDAGAGGNTFLFNSGFGNATILDATGDTIRFGTGITKASLTFTPILGTNGATPGFSISGAGATITVANGLVPGVIDAIAFADGSTYTVPQIFAPSGRATIAGSSGNLILSSLVDDSVSGGSGQDTVDTWGDSDTLSAGSAGTLIYAGGADDSVIGGAGNDTLVALGTADTLVAGTGSETLEVNDASAIVEVSAGAGSDTVLSSVDYTVPTNVSVMTMIGSSAIQATANAGNDVITANSGADTLFAGPGTDTLIGGAGNDLFVVNNSSDVVQNSYVSANDTIQSSVSYSIPANVNTLVLTGGGPATGTGNAGSDYLVGTTGATTLISGTGVDTLVGGGGVTVFVVNNSGDIVQDDSEFVSDSVISSTSFTLTTRTVTALTLTGSANILGAEQNVIGEVVITGNAGNDTLVAGSSGDTLVAGTGIDTMLGAGGGFTRTTFVVNNPADVVVGQAGNLDTVRSAASYTLPTGVFEDTLVLTGSANITGAAGNDSTALVIANTGHDTLVAGSGADTLEAGSGSGIQTMIAGTGNAWLQANTGSTFIFNPGFGNDTIVNDLTSATVSFGAGVNPADLTVQAAVGAGNSWTLKINSGSGSILLNGALAGVTYTFSFNGGPSLTLAEFLSDVDVPTSSVSDGFGDEFLLEGDPSTSVTADDGSDVIWAAGASDTITGSAVTRQSLYAFGANDSVVSANAFADMAGFGQGDTLVASSSTGNDTLTGGTGATVVFVINSSSDVIQLQANPGNDTLMSSVAYSLPTNLNTLVLTGTAALKGTANNGIDTLIANSGADTLVAGHGNDLFIVNSTSDVVSVGGTHGVDTIQSSVSFSASANVSALVLTGTADLSGTGNSLTDVITANSGNDTLTAGTGVATLIGGTGNDTFVVNNISDVVQETTSGTSSVVRSSVSYSLPTNVNSLVLTGTTGVKGTANNGNDTLTSNTGIDTLVGGTGSDVFIVNNSSDVVQHTSPTGTNVVQASVSFTLPTTVSILVLTGTAALKGTANSGNDSLVANSGNDTLVALGAGADTLVAGTTGTDSLVGGTGNDTFIVNNTADIVTDTSTTASNILMSSVTYSLPTNVNTMILTGTAALKATGNAHADTITGNSGADTLVAGTGVATLIGGAGTDNFVVNNTADVVTVTATGTNDVIQSSVNYTLPTNVQYLTLTGTAALTATGNGSTDLIVGNTGNDTLLGGAGIAVLEGGRTAGSDVLTATGNQAALIGGAGAATLTGGSFKDFLAAGKVSDSITTGATANVVAVNKGDGATTLQPTSGATNVLSLGAGIDTESLTFTKSSNNLVLKDGVTGDSITFTNWYLGAADQNYTKLQVVEIASASYNGSGTDPLRNQALEEFNFSSLVSQFNTAGSPANWALSNGMSSAQLSSSATAAYGGDLAYYFGLNGNLTGMNLSAAQSTLTDSSFATAAQTIDAFGGISGGGLQLLAKPVTAAEDISAAAESAAPATTHRGAVGVVGTFVNPMQIAWLRADSTPDETKDLTSGAADFHAENEPLATAALLAAGPTSRFRHVAAEHRPL